MDERGTEQTLLPNGCAYVTADNDGHFAISNSDNEVLFIGNTGIKGIQHYLKQLCPNDVLVNGADYESFQIANSRLVYFIYIRKTKDRATHFVAVEKTREGHSQGVKAFTGSLAEVEKDVQRYLSRANEKYYVHYLNEFYRLPNIAARITSKSESVF